jgi:hypothetical protein
MLFYDYHDAPNPRVVRMLAAEKGMDLPKRHVDVRDHYARFNCGG